MRITTKFIFKTLVLVVLIIFLMPVIFYHLDGKSESLEGSKRDHRRSTIQQMLNFGDQVHAPPKDDKYEHLGLGDLADAQVNNDESSKNEPAFRTKVFGPKAEFKSGVLGNYEPTHLVDSGGPGANGKPVYPSLSEKQEADKSVREFGFNMVVSDKIAMDRLIPDTRIDECKYWHYPDIKDLPKASVIIVFHNEGWSTLMRTVHSVINMSPPELLHEVVMVDDFSNKEHLKGRLDRYLSTEFNGKVKLFRNTERLGLIVTRTKGAEYSTGDVILFLDAHCECNKNWLVPLLARIAYDRTIMTVPVIDGIDWDNFRVSPVYQQGENYIGIFEWGFLYKESRVPARESAKHKYLSEPYKSPTHAGGLFAMDRKFFFELGAYDPGLLIWGGENFELSFKIWQCGGSIEWVPCSRVGHVYRNAMPYGFGNVKSKIPIVLQNYMRVVEVWMDEEYRDYFYTREPTVKGFDIGNLTSQLQLKKDLKCKSFKWFMENVAYEVNAKFPPPPPNQAWGEFRQKFGDSCWDTIGQSVNGGPIGVSTCHHFGGNQLYRLNVKGQLATGERCLESMGTQVRITFCPVQPTGPWHYEQTTGQIKHTTQNKCVSAAGSHAHLELVDCDENSRDQLWEINEIRAWERR